jgi:hypothetical protein
MKPISNARVTGRRLRVRRIIASLMLIVVSVGCASDGTPETPPSQAPATAPSSPSSPGASGDAGSALEGTWRTDPVSEADIEATLRDAGLQRWIQRLRELPDAAAPVDSNVFVLEIRDGRWDLYWEADGTAPERLDYDAAYEVDGDTVTVSHEGDFNRYRWSVVGDTLSLTWLDTTYGGYEGIPEKVFQTAFYMTATFES